MVTIGTLALAFGEGLALIVSPCILPVLPLMLGASLDGSKARPLGIVAGFILAFTLFALISRQAILSSGIDAETVRNISLVLLALFGLVMLLPSLSDKWGSYFQKFGGRGNDLIDRIQTQGFWGGLLIGALIGVVWTPCAGPILGAAILQIIQAETHAAALATIGAFAFGAGIPMFFIALLGRHFMHKLGFLKKHAYTVRRVIGIIMIAAAITIFTGLDLKLVAWQAKAEAQDNAPPSVSNMLEKSYAAPELTGITDWINSDPLTLTQLRGKVVLIDFWTYSCINCIRTMPYITKWYDKYKDDGLVVIGVHAPEFAFEKKRNNVEEAVKEYGIHYPVALDNNFSTWKAYKNQYWPAHYLIDREGRVVYMHFGEGKYAVTENNIRALLGIEGMATVKPVAIKTSDQTPETYLGYGRIENFVGTFTKDVQTNYAFPTSLKKDEWALSGPWTVEKQRSVAGENAALRLNFTAGKVFLVMGAATPTDVEVRIDNKLVKTVTVADEKLYELVREATLFGGTPSGILELRPLNPGLEVYAFTFGK